MRTGFVAMRFGWSAFVVPFLFIFSPSLLFEGDPVTLVHDVVTAIIGVWLISAALIGYLYRPIPLLIRATFILAGACLLIPLGTFPGAYWTDIAGVALAGTVIAREISAARRARPSEA
jgi:TRAP-type uncharacterized transport system fused permease subunit